MRARTLLRPFGTAGAASPSPQSSAPYIGEIMLWAGSFAPQGWLRCDGALVSISLYWDLFNIIGTTYGGDGQTNFALPDLRGRIPLHSGGSISYVIGQAAGTEAETLSTNQIPQHPHTAWAHGANGSSDSPSGTIPARDPAGGLHYAIAADSGLEADALAPAGGSAAHNNMQPYLAMTYCIAYAGIYPTQT